MKGKDDFCLNIFSEITTDINFWQIFTLVSNICTHIWSPPKIFSTNTFLLRDEPRNVKDFCESTHAKQFAKEAGTVTFARFTFSCYRLEELWIIIEHGLHSDLCSYQNDITDKLIKQLYFQISVLKYLNNICKQKLTSSSRKRLQIFIYASLMVTTITTWPRTTGYPSLQHRLKCRLCVCVSRLIFACSTESRIESWIFVLMLSLNCVFHWTE